MNAVPPTTVAGIERYLGSGLVKGIGPILAKKLVGRFAYWESCATHKHLSRVSGVLPDWCTAFVFCAGFVQEFA